MRDVVSFTVVLGAPLVSTAAFAQDVERARREGLFGSPSTRGSGAADCIGIGAENSRLRGGKIFTFHVSPEEYEQLAKQFNSIFRVR
jgi:hypothetical protein